MSETRTTKVSGRELRSGGLVPVSGIYTLDHQNCSNGDLWVKKGQRFPVCPNCGKDSVFLLEQAVEHISEDADFE